jgi:hypothetical protein
MVSTHQLVQHVHSDRDNGNIDQEEEDQARGRHSGKRIVGLANEACYRPVLRERHRVTAGRRGGAGNELRKHDLSRGHYLFLLIEYDFPARIERYLIT